MDNRAKYVAAAAAAFAFMATAYYYPAEVFITFVLGWLFFVPAAFIVYAVYGLLEHARGRRHRITVSVKPTGAIRALARKEAELKAEREMLYEELRRSMKRK